MNWIWLRRENFCRETLFLLILAQNNATWTHFVQVKSDDMHKNWKCRLHSDKEETVNHIIKECNKPAQK